MLTDGTITLRAPEPSDAELLYRWENDARFWEGGDVCAPLPRRLLDDFVNNYDGNIAATRQLRLMITDNATMTAVGTLDLFDYSPVNLRAGVGILIDSAFRRRGYALRALTLSADYCRRHLGLRQLWCHIAADNLPSRKLFEKAGFRSTGCMRSWLRRGDTFADAYIYQRLL